MSRNSSWPIIVVTGANSGVGFGICHRLLLQLSSKSPRDAHPQYDFHNKEKNFEELDTSYDGLTLILACRSKQRAEVAKEKLYKLVDDHIARLRTSPQYDGHADTFRSNLTIAVHTVDLSHIQSVFRFADEVSTKYPYISHLICNAGVASFAKINWLEATKQLITDWIGAVTAPLFYVQTVGERSADGLGWVWQCNVFGHYVLFKALEPHLAKYKISTGARVIWMSSHEANSKFYDPNDWQLVQSEHSYECSKYQMDMLSLHLDRQALQDHTNSGPIVRHITVLPGVAGTNIASALLGQLSSLGMFIAFYIARWMGSPYHLITAFKASISAVHLCLVPIIFLPIVTALTTSNTKDAATLAEVGVRYVSQSDRLGRERVGMVKLTQSRAEKDQTDQLVKNCEHLLKEFSQAEGRPW
ncbi:NAD(P)-binding protein [Hygrophoropsis aurantiaca]|uniref:NAD(P)-binding protein n=1 Tax=Hygrophoropsis aurantiaca TaxID=72124 RepID=A0ACB8ASI9_9AGAM|nr:NAD(P)-binding protein [Hygrophoropsis aurantiaca]